MHQDAVTITNEVITFEKNTKKNITLFLLVFILYKASKKAKVEIDSGLY